MMNGNGSRATISGADDRRYCEFYPTNRRVAPAARAAGSQNGVRKCKNGAEMKAARRSLCFMWRRPEASARGVPPPDLAAAKAVHFGRVRRLRHQRLNCGQSQLWEPLETWPPRYRRRGGRRDNWCERMNPRGLAIWTSRFARRSGGGHLSTRYDGAASYLGIATPNQRRIRLTAQSIASMLASFDMGDCVEETKLDLVRMPGA
jgi:hypothetical protein